MKLVLRGTFDLEIEGFDSKEELLSQQALYEINKDIRRALASRLTYQWDAVEVDTRLLTEDEAEAEYRAERAAAIR